MGLLILKSVYESDKLTFIMGSLILIMIIVGTTVNIMYYPTCNNYQYNESNVEFDLHGPGYGTYYAAAQTLQLEDVKNNKKFGAISSKIKYGIKGLFIISLIFIAFFSFYMIIGHTTNAIYSRASLFKNFGILTYKNATNINL